MKNFTLLLALLIGIFIIITQGCEKKELKPDKKLSKLEYLKQLTLNDNFEKIKSADKSNNTILDSLNWDLYRYYQDEDNPNLYQDIIIKEDKNTTDSLDYGWWIEIKSIGTLNTHIVGNSVVAITCDSDPNDCMNITFFGDDYILF